MLTSIGMQGLVLANSAPTHVGVNIPLKRGRILPLLVAGGIDLWKETERENSWERIDLKSNSRKNLKLVFS